MAGDFEREIRRLTAPINGQYPRPWMTDLTDPTQARVFVVGRNQATAYRVNMVGPHDRHLDALFNRAGQNCRGLYNELYAKAKPGKRSATRANIDDLTGRLAQRGVKAVLETNVICYSTPTSSDLRKPEHRGGKERGEEIFRALLTLIRPEVLIANGTGTIDDLNRLLDSPVPQPPKQDGEVACVETTYAGHRFCVIAIPSLAPPGYNRWSSWAPRHLDKVAAEVKRRLDTPPATG